MAKLMKYRDQTLKKFYVDTETTNESFIKMAILLQSRGVANYMFHLKLYDKSLSGVDVYEVSKLKGEKYNEIKSRIFAECAINRFYFVREVFRVAETGSGSEIGGGIQFKLNRGNLALLWAAELNLSVYMIMPRQFGKTWGAIADIVWDYQFNQNVSIIHFNKDQTNANDNLQRIKSAISMLPAYMQHSSEEYADAKDRRNTKNNDKYMRNTLNSSISAMSSASNENKADQMARGKTACKIWYDELAFIFFNKSIYEAATPAYQKAAKSAEENGVPYSTIITTTPGDLATPHGDFAYRFMNSCVKFTEDMYDWSGKTLESRINNNPIAKPFVFIQFRYFELGETRKWLQKESRRLGDNVKIKREYLLHWINTNSLSPFTEEDMEDLAQLNEEYFTDPNKKPTTIRINKYYELQVYKKPVNNKPVIISVDVAAGLGRDSTAVVVVDSETMEVIAVFRSNMVTIDNLAKFLVKLITKHYRNSILTVENNSIGDPLIKMLKDTPIKRHIYRQKSKRSVDNGVSAFTRKSKMDYVEYGHNTNSTTRPLMMNILENMVRYNRSHLAIPELYNEIKFLEYRQGRIQHSSATHDDTVMAYMGALYIIKYGTGLRTKGIYFNLVDREDDYEDYTDEETKRAVFKSIDRFYRKNPTSQKEIENEYFRQMSTPQPVLTSSGMRAAEEEEIRQMKAALMGVDLDDMEESSLNILSANNAKLLLRNMDDDIGNDYASIERIRFADMEDEDSVVYGGNPYSLFDD